MNIKNLLIGSTLLLSSVIGVVSPAEARPTRVVQFTTSQGTRVSMAPVGYRGVEVVVDNQYEGAGFIGNMDCGTGRYQWRANDGYPEYQIRSILTKACNY